MRVCTSRSRRVCVCVRCSICMICACVHTPQQVHVCALQQVHVEVRGPLARVNSLLLPRGSQGPYPSFISLGGRCSSLGAFSLTHHLWWSSDVISLLIECEHFEMDIHGQYLWSHLRLKIVLCETPTSLLESCTPYVRDKYLLRNSFSFSHFLLVLMMPYTSVFTFQHCLPHTA